MKTNTFVLVLVTCLPNEAKEVARALIKKKIAACVSIIPKVSSIYFWNNTVTSDRESQLLIKTKSVCLKKIKTYLSQALSYENPEIIALPIIDGSDTYLQWIEDSLER